MEIHISKIAILLFNPSIGPSLVKPARQSLAPARTLQALTTKTTWFKCSVYYV